jgi:hypothetical protein
MAFYEQHIQLPTFVLENQRWANNFNKEYFFVTNKKNMAKDVLDMYNSAVDASTWYASGSLKHAQQHEASVFHKWNDLFNQFKPRKSNTNTAKICGETTLKLQDYITQLNRSIICIDDIRSVFTNKHKFEVIYTDDDTWLTKEKNFQPLVEETSLNLFEGI